MLELLLFETERFFCTQPYQETLFKALLAPAYHGLFRVGELTCSDHVLKAKDVHIGRNKNKMLFILYSSKTHSTGSRPQKVKISANSEWEDSWSKKLFFSPFTLMQNYIQLRGDDYVSNSEQFFLFRRKIPVEPHHMRSTLKKLITNIGLDARLYETHSLHIGKASDMLCRGEPIEKIKLTGRWKSNAVYKYLRFE